MIEKTLANIKGLVVFGFATVNTFFWFVPLIVFTILKFLVPINVFRLMMSRWVTAIGENWISCNILVFGIANRTRYDLRGVEELSRSKWYLLVVNHQTWVDVVALQTALNRRIPFLKFFVKQQLIWFPLLGIAFWAMDMPFMKRHSKAYLKAHPEQRGRDLIATKMACERFHATPTSVINFVEGTRFNEDKQRDRKSPYRHLLPPRSGGMAVALSSMGAMFDSILDVTIFYPGRPPTFWDLMCGRFKEVVIEVVARPVHEWIVEGDYLDDRDFRRRFRHWLTEIWAEKDARLQALSAR